MKRKTKLLLEVLAAAMLICLLAVGIFSSSAASDDPADDYDVQEAPYEDETIDMWFDYSFRKNYSSDTESTGMDTFSIYMGKNEIESAQFLLYSEDDHLKMKAEITPFTDGKGNTVDAEIYYEFYTTLSNLDTGNVLGGSRSNTFIRNGECPDPVAPLSSVGTFKLVGGKSQAFLIRARTLETSVAGWYSAQLNIKDSGGNVVKTATVYMRVWDFVISEKTELKTAWFMDSKVTYGGSYEIFYNYLLENRLNAMDMPGGRPSSENAYITNDRVAAIRITSTGIGSAGVGGYLEHGGDYVSIYEDLRQADYWNDVKDKFYFYPGDEPMSLEQQTGIGAASYADTVDTVNPRGKDIQSIWPDAKIVMPFHENHPYPYNYYHKDVNTYADYQKKDGFQQMLDYDYVSVICPQLYAFTPTSVLKKMGYSGWGGQAARNLSCSISGMYAKTSISAGDWANNPVYWEAIYGDAYDRLASNLALGEDYLETWAYTVSHSTAYTYCGHNIENTGLQNKMLFWQLYQNGVTGYLYYAANNWGGTPDETDTGAKTNVRWYINPSSNGTYTTYGDCVLFYGRSMGYVNVDVIGSLRVEILRDGVEEYQMMYQLSELAGDKEAMSYVNSVSNNVADYISLPNYDRSAWSSSMDEYDIMEAARRNLGNALETATLKACEHSYGEGVVTVPAGCITVGTMSYTCSLCGAEKQETIPMLHESGESYVVESETSVASCSTVGKKIVRCSVCNYRREITTPSFHQTQEYLRYESISTLQHQIYCTVCDSNLGKGYHIGGFFMTDPTCTEEGEKYTGCIYCKYEIVEKEAIPAKGHNYVDGYCTGCGESEAEAVVPGDLNGDGKVTATDVNIVLRAIVGSVTLDSAQEIAADVTGDGKITATDVNYINQYLTGSVSSFPVEKK